MLREDDHDTATASQAAQVHERRCWADFLIHRWPTALGVAVAALTFFDEQVTVEFVSVVSAIVVLMALIYLGAAALEPRRAHGSFSWSDLPFSSLGACSTRAPALQLSF